MQYLLTYYKQADEKCTIIISMQVTGFEWNMVFLGLVGRFEILIWVGNEDVTLKEFIS